MTWALRPKTELTLLSPTITKELSVLFFANPVALLRTLQLLGHIFNSTVKSLHSRVNGFHTC